MDWKVPLLATILGFMLGLGTAYAQQAEVVKIIPASVTVVMPTDLNGDRKVDTADLLILVENLHTTNLDYDLNDDGRVDVLDLALVAADFGKIF